MRITEQMIFESLFVELRHKATGIEINREFDIPYLAGYSLSGRVLYVDRDFPKELGLIEFLAFHEICEKFFESSYSHEHYQNAHELATKLEHYLVRLHGMDPDEYEDVIQTWIKKIGKKEPKKCPPDLDLEPYEDEHDDEMIEKIKRAQ